MAVPDYQTLMLPLLQLAGEGRQTIKECVPAIVQRFDLTEEDVGEMLPSGRQVTLLNRMHWAKTYLAKAGLLAPIKRGVFEITAEGQALLARRPERIDNRTLDEFGDFAAWRTRSSGVEGDERSSMPAEPLTREASSLTPLERIDSARKEIEATLADDLLTRLLNGTPAFFEKAVVDLLVAMGYGRGRDGAGQRLGRAGDGGIDGVINEDALGLDAVYVQAKRYAPENLIGRPAIQQFVGSLTGEGAGKGVFVTTSGFSAEAQRYVERIAQRVVLIDGQRFARLMIAHGVGVRGVETITLSEVDENFFAED
jgi:restriction system protein